MFGIDSVDITLSGTSTPTTASCCGTAAQAPGMPFKANSLDRGRIARSCLENDADLNLLIQTVG